MFKLYYALVDMFILTLCCPFTVNWRIYRQLIYVTDKFQMRKCNVGILLAVAYSYILWDF